MFLLGVLAFLQITVIPGAIILRASNFQGTILERLVYAFALSLMTTYSLVFFLTVIHLYNQLSASIVLGGEFIGLAWLYKKDLQVPAFETLQHQFDKFRNSINAFILPDVESKPSMSGPSSLLNVLVTLALSVFALSGVVWTIRIFISSLGSVFDAWDAVVSWNRWALSWASGQIPLDSGLYPQLIPSNWSFTYVLIGDTTIQAIAKGIMPLFAVCILLAFVDLGLATKSMGFFIGGIFAQLLMKKFLAPEITSGYVDVAVAFFGLLAIHALIKAGSLNNASHSNQYLLLGTVFAAGAAVTKQPGIYIFALYPILAYVNAVRHNHPWSKKNIKKYLVPFLLVSMIPLSWYIFKQIHFIQNVEIFDIQEYFDVTSSAYGHLSLAAQVAAALSQFGKYLILFVFIIAGFPLLNLFYRALTILIIFPYPLIWAWMAGYDTRNLAIFIPIFALTAGVALQELFSFFIKLLERTAFFHLKTYSILAILFLAIILGSLAIPSGRLVEQQIKLQRQIFSPSKNEKIYALIEQDGPDTKILTNYPVRFLPGLENNQIQFGYQNLDSFIALVEDPEIDYILFPNRTSDKIKRYIEGKIDNGDYELIFVDTEWITYSMVRIIKQ